MKRIIPTVALALVVLLVRATTESAPPKPADTYGPAAALAFEEKYKGDCCKPGDLHCYPDAKGVPFADCVNIIPMTNLLWTPDEIRADFQMRMKAIPAQDRKKGIIVMLKTERCATKAARACTITTAVLEKRSTPLVAQFLVYGVQIKPRDNDNPPGTLPIETGADAWKNKAAGEYRFIQGPGATIVFLNPEGAKVATTNATDLNLLEANFVKNQGRTPELQKMLEDVLRKIENGETAGSPSGTDSNQTAATTGKSRVD